MRVRSAISTDMAGVQWRKLDVELEESDRERVLAESGLDGTASTAKQFNAMRKKADSLLVYWMNKEGLLTGEQAAAQLKEIASS